MELFLPLILHIKYINRICTEYACRDFGLKTYKVKAYPRSDREKSILLNDKNAWVAIPTNLMTAKEAKPPISDFEKRL